jgi:hypothetical protein
MPKFAAKWMTRGKAHWVGVWVGEDGIAMYRGNGCGGCLGPMTEAEAIAEIQRRVDLGHFSPDAAKTRMQRVI